MDAVCPASERRAFFFVAFFAPFCLRTVSRASLRGVAVLLGLEESSYDFLKGTAGAGTGVCVFALLVAFVVAEALGFFSLLVLEGVLAGMDEAPMLEGGGTGVSFLTAPSDTCELGTGVDAAAFDLCLLAAAPDAAVLRLRVAVGCEVTAPEGASAISSSESLLESAFDVDEPLFCEMVGAAAAGSLGTPIGVKRGRKPCGCWRTVLGLMA